MAKPTNDWTIINAGRGGRYECLRCGRYYMPAFPIELWAMSALAKAFTREHRACRLKPEGLHCTMCGATGHPPMACAELHAKTPEQWLAGPDTGISSKTIYGTLYRAIGSHSHDHGPPYDPGDFGRCYRLLELFPDWRPRLGEVAVAHPRWRPLVDAWDELTTLYEEELPNHVGAAPKLYARMKQLLGVT